MLTGVSYWQLKNGRLNILALYQLTKYIGRVKQDKLVCEGERLADLVLGIFVSKRGNMEGKAKQ